VKLTSSRSELPATGRRRALRSARAVGRNTALALLTAFSAMPVFAPAQALVIELKDVASDRVERQRAEAMGQVPLPGTPNVGQLAERLAEKKMALGNPILIRVFKASSELEIWMQKDERFELFATYPICNWSGTLGPKLTEGDKQSPEGVYTVTSRQLHLIGRHPRSLNLGFPNALDRQMNRTGSYILIHGGCGSVGCFAMTNPVIEEVYSLASAALGKGKQEAVQVHVFPFRMTEERLKAYALNEWYDFWRNLKDVADSFDRTRLPPKVSICEGRYWVDDATAEEVASQGPLAVCAVSQGEAASLSKPADAAQHVSLPWWPHRAMVHPALVASRPSAPMVHSPRERQQAAALSSVQFNARLFLSNLRNQDGRSSAPPAPVVVTRKDRTSQLAAHAAPSRPVKVALASPTTPCSPSRASCRAWMATHAAQLQNQNRAHVQMQSPPTKRPRANRAALHSS